MGLPFPLGYRTPCPYYQQSDKNHYPDSRNNDQDYRERIYLYDLIRLFFHAVSENSLRDLASRKALLVQYAFAAVFHGCVTDIAPCVGIFQESGLIGIRNRRSNHKSSFSLRKAHVFREHADPARLNFKRR